MIGIKFKINWTYSNPAHVTFFLHNLRSIWCLSAKVGDKLLSLLAKWVEIYYLAVTLYRVIDFQIKLCLYSLARIQTLALFILGNSVTCDD